MYFVLFRNADASIPGDAEGGSLLHRSTRISVAISATKQFWLIL